MHVKLGNGVTKYGPGVDVVLSGDEVAMAIFAYLVAHGICVTGPRTITVNGELCEGGNVYVDPSGFVVSEGEKYSGDGTTDFSIARSSAEIDAIKAIEAALKIESLWMPPDGEFDPEHANEVAALERMRKQFQEVLAKRK